MVAAVSDARRPLITMKSCSSFVRLREMETCSCKSSNMSWLSGWGDLTELTRLFLYIEREHGCIILRWRFAVGNTLVNTAAKSVWTSDGRHGWPRWRRWWGSIPLHALRTRCDWKTTKCNLSLRGVTDRPRPATRPAKRGRKQGADAKFTPVSTGVRDHDYWNQR